MSLEWCVPGQRRLLLKAAQAYRVLADAAMAVNRLGRSLRYTRMCILCCCESMTIEGVALDNIRSGSP